MNLVPMLMLGGWGNLTETSDEFLLMGGILIALGLYAIVNAVRDRSRRWALAVFGSALAAIGAWFTLARSVLPEIMLGLPILPALVLLVCIKVRSRKS